MRCSSCYSSRSWRASSFRFLPIKVRVGRRNAGGERQARLRGHPRGHLHVCAAAGGHSQVPPGGGCRRPQRGQGRLLQRGRGGQEEGAAPTPGEGADGGARGRVLWSPRQGKSHQVQQYRKDRENGRIGYPLLWRSLLFCGYFADWVYYYKTIDQ